MMAKIVHIVMFQFKADAGSTTVKEACQRMLALKDLCLHPTSQKPYITSSVGGKDNSPEGMQGGLTHAFIVEFDSEEDRKFYLEADPAHLSFVKSVSGIIEQARVVDFTPGLY